jgi:predicted esterase
MAVLSIGCGGDDAECSGSEVTGGPVKCGMPGTFDRTACIDGKLRKFREYVPETVTCDAPVPLIVFLHGNGSTEDSGDVARPIADEFGAVYMSLRGYQQDGYFGFGPEGVDNSRAFLTALLDSVRREFPTDPQFTLLTGFSAGGIFASYCIAWLNDRLSGVGVFAGGLAEPWETELTAAPVKMPVLIRVGEEDNFQRYADSLVGQLDRSGWPKERVDSQRFAGGHKWSPEMIGDAFRFAKSFSQF